VFFVFSLIFILFVFVLLSLFIICLFFFLIFSKKGRARSSAKSNREVEDSAKRALCLH